MGLHLITFLREYLLLSSINYGLEYGALPTPTREGYTFNGWYTAKSGGSKVTASTTVTKAANHKLYALWTANTYTISFNKNGGSGTMSSITATYDESVTLTDNKFTRDKYEFTEWNTKADGSGTSYSNKAIVKNLATSGTAKLYAQWEQVEFTIDELAAVTGKSVDDLTMRVNIDSSVAPGESKKATCNAPSGYTLKKGDICGFYADSSICKVVSYKIINNGASVEVTLENVSGSTVGSGSLTAHSGGFIYVKK